LDETIYSVNGLPEVSEDLHISLGFVCGEDDLYTIEVSYGSMFGSNAEIYLEDKQTSQIQDMKENNQYSFSSDLMDNKDRFVVHFSNPLSVEEQMFDELFDISILDNTIILDYSGTENGYARIIDLTGRSLSEKELVSGQNQFMLNRSTAWYLVAIQVGDENLTKKVFVK
jgi:hypothetical protein